MFAHFHGNIDTKNMELSLMCVRALWNKMKRKDVANKQTTDDNTAKGKEWNLLSTRSRTELPRRQSKTESRK